MVQTTRSEEVCSGKNLKICTDYRLKTYDGYSCFENINWKKSPLGSEHQVFDNYSFNERPKPDPLKGTVSSHTSSLNDGL